MFTFRLSLSSLGLISLCAALSCTTDGADSVMSADGGGADAASGANPDSGTNQGAKDAGSKPGNGKPGDAGLNRDAAAPDAALLDAATSPSDGGTTRDAALPPTPQDSGNPAPVSPLPSCTESSGGFGCEPPSTVWTCQAKPTKAEEKLIRRNCRDLATGLIRYCCDF